MRPWIIALVAVFWRINWFVFPPTGEKTKKFQQIYNFVCFSYSTVNVNKLNVKLK